MTPEERKQAALCLREIARRLETGMEILEGSLDWECGLVYQPIYDHVIYLKADIKISQEARLYEENAT